MAVHVPFGSTSGRARTPRRRTRALGRLLVAAGLIVGVLGALMPSASAISQPGSIDGGDWNDGWSSGDPWPPTGSDEWPVPAENPGIEARCGIDIAVLVDRSGSIADAGQAASYKSAVKDLVDAFAGTPSNLGVWSFGGHASDTDDTAYPWAQMAALDGVNGPTNVAALKATVDGIPIVSNEATNWEEGIRAILTPPVAASPAPDLLVVLTDGQPTVHADDDGSGGTVNNDDLAGGIASANLVKESGTRLLAVGVGPNVAVNGLKLISGTTAFDGTNISTADYLTTSFADLSDSLQQFATAVCGGSVTVTKEVSTLDDPSTYAPAAGWTFTGSIDEPPPSATADPDQPATTATDDGLTGDDGEVTFGWSSVGSETITITETQQEGFELVEVECELDGQSVPFEEVPDGIVLAVAQGEQVECTFRNRPVFVDLSVVKSDEEDVARPGDLLYYGIKYLNAADATATATDVVLTEVVPGHATYVASGSDAWSCADGSPAGTVCTLAVGDLAPGEGGVASFVVQVDAPVAASATQVVNTVTVTGAGAERDELDQEATDVDTIDAAPIITVSKEDDDDDDVVQPGDTLRYVITVGNEGDRDAEGVVVTETVPELTTFDASAPDNDVWTDLGGGSFSTTVDVPAGETVTRYFTVVVDAGVPVDASTIHNVVGACHPASEQCSEGDDEDWLDAEPLITVDKENEGNDDVVEPGETVRYVITVGNEGDRDAEGVVVTETVPALTTFDPSAPGNDVWSDHLDGSFSTSVDVPAGETVTLYFTVVVDPTVAADAYRIDNTVTACRPLPFPGFSDVPGFSGPARGLALDLPFPFPFPFEICDDGVDEDWLDADALITVEKENEGNDDVVEPGETVVYVVTVANEGDRDAEDIFVGEAVPASTSFAATAPGNEVWTDLGGGEYSTIVDIPAGGSVVLTFTVTVDEPVPAGVDTIHNEVEACPPVVLEASLALLDGLVVPDLVLCVSGTDDDALDAAPDLVVSKDDGGVSARPGDEVTYTIEFANTGDQDATGVVLTETLPAGTTFVGPASWQCAGTTCTHEVGDLDAGASGSVAFTVRIDTALPATQTEVVNRVVIDDDGKNGEDPAVGNNSDTDATPVTRSVSVLPNVVERPAQPAAGSQLPRTGASSMRLVLLSGLLTMLGGLLLVGESILEQRRRRVLPRSR